MKHLNVGIDIDNVINNLAEILLKVFNEDTGQNVKLSDIKSYYIERWVDSKYSDKITALFADKRVWKQISLVDNCRNFIQKLVEDGHRIIFVTATDPSNIAKKFSWLSRNFPFIDIKRNLVMIHTKQLLSELDVLVDDYENNLIDGNYSKILLNYPWNNGINDERYGIIRCNDWREIYNEICKIAETEINEDNKI